MAKKIFTIIVFISGIVMVLLNKLSLSDITVYFNYEPETTYNIVVAFITALIYVILALNEVTIVDNGYEKKYSFKNFIIVVSLLIVGSKSTLIAAMVAIILSVVLNAIRNRDFKINNIIFKLSTSLISAGTMCFLFFHWGGKKNPIVNFPENFLIILGIGFICYIIDTTINITSSYFDGRLKKGFFKVFFQEYGWIYKYELWQGIYAILFYNSAAVFLFGNFTYKQVNDDPTDAMERAMMMVGLFDDKAMILNKFGEYQVDKMPENFLYFLAWQIALVFIMYIPINGWLSSFKTFIYYNNQNVSNAIRNMKEGIILLDPDGKVVNVNDSAVNMLSGFSTLDKGESIINTFIHLGDKVKNGREKITNMLESLNSKDKEFVTELEITDNEDTNYLNVIITPEVNRFNEITGTVMTIEDITNYRKMIEEINTKNIWLEELKMELEKRLRELQETQEKLIISEKMAVIGQLVSGIAHEINTPLASIKANIDVERVLVGMLDPSNTKTFEKFKTTFDSLFEINNEAMQRIIDIVKGLKNFARLDEAEFKVVDIREGIDSTILLVKNQHSGKIDILKEFADIPSVKCFAQQLNQVFLNIIMNSIQAIKESGTITIKTWAENQQVYVSIMDTGDGIKEEHVSRIFDPGFTTKGVGVGTGLGLSISYKIIERHKGEIKVESEVGKGTTMTIILPVDMESISEVTV